MPSTEQNRSLMWFRRDLRVSDNPTLRAAIDESDQIVPVFVIDPELWEAAPANRRWFLAGSLRALDDALGGGLVVRSGHPATVLRSLAAEVGADTVFHASDVGPHARRRDEAVGNALTNDNRRMAPVDTPYVVPPGELCTKSGGTYKVFTPFFRAWSDMPVADPIPRPRRMDLVDGVDTEPLPDLPEIDAELPEPGEEAARSRVDRFLRSAVDRYDDRRDDPAGDHTSRLSADLKFGTVHPRQLLSRLDRRNPGHDAFAQELAWRDFYGHVLHAWPDSAWSAWNDQLADIELDSGDEADERFRAWCDGETGYPFVDAGMRQLRTEGWMHNRARMATASFLVKDLHLDWTRGARWFLRHLVDGDIASNNHGWQWAAGTGTDAAPYFRVFNPIRQSERFDPDGQYIRRWVPELADVDTADIHEPWKLPDGPPPGYPSPIVDHGEEREEALRRYERATS